MWTVLIGEFLWHNARQGAQEHSLRLKLKLRHRAGFFVAALSRDSARDTATLPVGY
jgi:hypothetical protein